MYTKLEQHHEEPIVKGFIYSDEPVYFGSPKIVGFGSEDFNVKLIDRDLAYQIIEQNHYAKKGDTRPHNRLNLGVFIKNEMLGVIQFGYAMNPQSCSKVVDGTSVDQYLELNRMWFCDSTCRNAKSRALSHSFRVIRRQFPSVKWIQSFADERCSKYGIVYQASNFTYHGEHKGTFYLDGDEVIHNVTATNYGRYIGDAERLEYRQFRYIYWLDHKWRQKCLLDELDYPKHYT